MVSIDHTAYPHVLDRIVAVSDVDALFALRATSRIFRDRADVLIFAELEIRYAPPDRIVRFASRAGLLHPAPERVVPYKHGLNKVVDIVSFVPAYVDFGDADRAAVQLHPPSIVRRIGDGVVSRDGGKLFKHVDTVVDFIDLHSYPTAQDRFHEYNGVLDGPHVSRLSHRMRRYIAHIRLDELSTAPPHLNRFFPLMGLADSGRRQEFIVIIHNPAGPEQADLMLRAIDGVFDSLHVMMVGPPLSLVRAGNSGNQDWEVEFRRRLQTMVENVAEDEFLLFAGMPPPRYFKMGDWKDQQRAEFVSEWTGRERVVPARWRVVKRRGGR